MKPFAIAGIQMKVSAVASNVEMMKLKIDITMNLYPWIEMIVFSELCAFGPLSHAAQPFQIILKQKCKLKLRIWNILPGSIFEKSEGNIYNTASVINPQR
jgi:predicted amidohydrolase